MTSCWPDARRSLQHANVEVPVRGHRAGQCTCMTPSPGGYLDRSGLLGEREKGRNCSAILTIRYFSANKRKEKGPNVVCKKIAAKPEQRRRVEDNIEPLSIPSEASGPNGRQRSLIIISGLASSHKNPASTAQQASEIFSTGWYRSATGPCLSHDQKLFGKHRDVKHRIS